MIPVEAPMVSVIIATRGRSAGCARLSQEIERQLGEESDLKLEIILVFDGCDPYHWFREHDYYRCVALPKRQGIARARNAGIAASTGTILAFLDDDCVPGDKWLHSLAAALPRYPLAVAFGGRVFGTDHHNLYAQLRDQVYYRETFGGWYCDVQWSGDLVGTPYVNGGNSAYRGDRLRASNGFDPILPAYSDVEMGRRLGLRERGVLLEGMVIHHDHPSTFRQYMARCFRSGRARGLLWSRYRYDQDTPAAVLRAITMNILWNNFFRRSSRIEAPRLHTVIVLFCQEVLHGFGYALSLRRQR